MENFRFRVRRLSSTTLFETTDQPVASARKTWELLNYKFPEMDGYRVDIYRVTPRSICQSNHNRLMEG